ncbi:hypothetical protein VDT1_2345 [Vibrio sp. 16]|nr:hypothetical protein VDT1_2345 [Vibrio sp. 16]
MVVFFISDVFIIFQLAGALSSRERNDLVGDI